MTLPPLGIMDSTIRDLRFALRGLRRRPGFAFAAILCLGLGIGATTAAFSVVHGVLYRTLPFEEPDRIVSVEAASEARGISDAGLAFADLSDLEESGVFEELGGATLRSVTLTGGDAAERVQGAAVTPDLFGLLGVRPALGRDFAPHEAAAAGFEEVVIVSHSLWQRRFAGSPDVLGESLRMNGRELVIVGVMPEGFHFPETQELWLPLGASSATERSARWVWGVGRLAGGVDREDGQARLEEISGRLAAEYPDSHRGWSFQVRPFRDTFIHPMARRLFHLMLGAVGLVLLVACANVASLLLARGIDREREVAVRTAVGASRNRVVRQLLTEALVLGMAGAVVGWLVAEGSVAWAVSRIPEDMAYWMRVEMDRTVLGFTLLLALATSLLFGMVPALRASRSSGTIGAGERLTAGRGAGSLRGSLVSAEVALSLVLLVGAGLLVRSFLHLGQASPGFDTHDVLSFRTVLAGDRYDPGPAKAEFFQGAAETLETLPGILGATATSSIPADDGGPLRAVSTLEETPPEQRTAATVVGSTAGFFRTLGVELSAGREFTAAEARDTAADVTVLGQSLARRLWPDEEAVGQRIHVEGAGWYRVVGVAPDLQYEEFGEETAASRLQMHVPYGVLGWRGMAFLVRVAGDPVPAAAAVRRALGELDPDLAPWDQMTMEERLRFTTWPQRFFAFLFTGYGAGALVLALTGMYGVLAYEVGRRRREIGVRMALGASRALVVREVVLRAARLAAVGTAVGLGAALLLARGMRGVLYGVAETDAATFVLVTVSLTAAALVAGYLPARRAARLQPSEALRVE